MAAMAATTAAATVGGGREFQVAGRLMEIQWGYWKTKSGLLKIAQMATSLLTLVISATVGSAFSRGERGWALFVSFVGVLGTLTLFVAFVLTLNKTLRQLKWDLIERVYYSVMTFCFLVAGILMAILAARLGNMNSSWRALPAIASTLLFVCMLLFGVDAFLKFLEWKNEAEEMPSQSNGREE